MINKNRKVLYFILGIFVCLLLVFGGIFLGRTIFNAKEVSNNSENTNVDDTNNNTIVEDDNSKRRAVSYEVKSIGDFVYRINNYMPSFENDIRETTITYGSLKLKATIDSYDEIGFTYDIYYNGEKIKKKYLKAIDLNLSNFEANRAYNINDEAILILGEQVPVPAMSVYEITMFDKNGKILFEENETISEIDFIENNNELIYTVIDDYQNLILDPCDELSDLSKDKVLKTYFRYKYEDGKMKLAEEKKYTVLDHMKVNNCN